MEFNDYLLEKCWVKYDTYYKDREDFNQHYYSGEVKMAVPDILTLYEEYQRINPQLPSQFKHGDKVFIQIGNCGKIGNGKIIKVHFSDRKVLYDVEICYKYNDSDEIKGLTRLYNIKSDFIFEEY